MQKSKPLFEDVHPVALVIRYTYIVSIWIHGTMHLMGNYLNSRWRASRIQLNELFLLDSKFGLWKQQIRV